MPLFGPKKSPPFEPFKSKTYLKCAVARIKQSTAAKQNENKVRAKELGALLRDGKEEMARIRVEHLIRATNEIHGMEIIELFCDLLLARHLLIESEARTQIAAGGRMNVSPPPELQEAIFSLCWAAGRAGVDELGPLKEQFKLLYPKAFNLDEYGQELVALGPAGTQAAALPVDNLPELRVNKKLREYFSVDVPPRQKVVDFLTNIGAVYAPDWEPSPELLDPKDENLIDVDTSYLVRPGQFEPGFGQAPHAHNPLATAPPPTDSVLFADFPAVPGAAAGGAVGAPPPADFDSFFPPPPGEKGAGGAAAPPVVPNVVIPQAHVVNPPPPGYQPQPHMPGGVQAPVVGQVVGGAPPDFDELEARFKAIAGGAPPAEPPGFSGAPAPQPEPEPAGVTDDLEARLAALSGAPAPAPAPALAPAPAPPPAPAPTPALPPAPADDLEARLAALSGGGGGAAPSPAPSPPPALPPAPVDDLEARLAALSGGGGGAAPSVPPPAMPTLGDDAASAALLQRQPGETMDAYEARLSALAAVQPSAPAPANGGPGAPPGLDDLDMLASLPSAPGEPPAGSGAPPADDDDLEARFRRLQGGD